MITEKNLCAKADSLKRYIDTFNKHDEELFVQAGK
jgi:hypothetical protein